MDDITYTRCPGRDCHSYAMQRKHVSWQAFICSFKILLNSFLELFCYEKAFTKEADDADDDESPLPSVPSGGKNYITPQGYARIRNELLDLIDNERPKVVEIVPWAASNGDHSENGDYIYV